MRTNFSLEGAKRLAKQVKELGDLSQRSVQLAARKGAVFAQRQAKQNAPVDLGNLKKGIRVVGERFTKKGKKVYMVAFDYGMNNIFQKFNAKAKSEKASGKKVSATAYYPASQEYGWRLPNGRKMPGKFFLRNAVAKNRPQIKEIIYNELDRQMEKLINKV